MTALTIKEAAALIRRDARTIERYISKGLPSMLLFGQRYVVQATLVQWVSVNGRKRGREHGSKAPPDVGGNS